MPNNQNTETDFSLILDNVLRRRQLLIGCGALSGIGLTWTPGVWAMDEIPSETTLDFEAVPANLLDTVTVPPGHAWHVVASWGDPLWSYGERFNEETRGSAHSQKLAFGDNNDGMELFVSNTRTLLAVNNEYVNLPVMYGNRASRAPETSEDVMKGQAAIGITIMEISLFNGTWSITKDSPLNRRITAQTPMKLTGPAAGTKLTITDLDPDGNLPLGTLNNCGSGRTPWNTYLSCEENFNLFFASSDREHNLSEECRRYGIRKNDRGYSWYSHDERFDIAKHPNEVNRFGYIVEIDPLNPSSLPKKHSALGRFKHENASVVVSKDNRIVVYMGDDERGEFLYRFISDSIFHPDADNSKILESGSLYVAKFADNERGKWVELTAESTGMASQAEVCVHTRKAGSIVGATTMDRPEWIAAHPHDEAIYCCLTNNKNRGRKTNAGGDKTSVDGPNPRPNNIYGHIIRWRPDEDDHANSDFSWDIFALAGNPHIHSGLNAGSPNINPTNVFNSPDGLAFDSLGRLWIQTDGNYSNEGDFFRMGNNQMLVADTNTGEIKRFLVGPRECEVTGVTWSTDRKTMFVGIQHPGERGHSHFPGGKQSIPRSSIIAISRDDGKIIG